MRRRSFQDRVSDDGFWFTVLHPFVCPACDGEGGDWESPFEPGYDCGFCKGRGCVGLWAKFLTLHDWALDTFLGNIRYAKEQRAHKEKSC